MRPRAAPRTRPRRSRKAGSLAYRPARHAHVLRALAGEEERHRPAPCRRAALVSSALAARRQRRAPRPRASRHDQHAAVREAPAAHLQRVGHVRQRQLRVRAPGARRRFVRRRARAPPRVRAESTSSCHGARRRRAGAAAGASSRTTWALVPPMPNELTPARARAARAPATARSCGVDEEGPVARSRCAGLGVSKCRLGGSCRCSSAAPS